MRKSELPSKSDIVRYWYDYAVKEWDETRTVQNFLRFTTDLGEPVCWACQRYYREYDYCNYPKADKKGDDGLFANWNRVVGLDRCHIVPKSRGGTNEPSNLVLMCHTCHREAPDTVFPEYLFTWMNNREKSITDDFSERFHKACKQLGVDDVSGLMTKYAIIERVYPEYEKFEEANTSLHWDKRSGATLSMTSVLSVMIEFLRAKGNPSVDDMLNLTRIRG